MRGLVEEASTLASEERATRRTQECGCEDDTTAKLEEEEEEEEEEEAKSATISSVDALKNEGPVPTAATTTTAATTSRSQKQKQKKNDPLSPQVKERPVSRAHQIGSPSLAGHQLPARSLLVGWCDRVPGRFPYRFSFFFRWNQTKNGDDTFRYRRQGLGHRFQVELCVNTSKTRVIKDTHTHTHTANSSFCWRFAFVYRVSRTVTEFRAGSSNGAGLLRVFLVAFFFLWPPANSSFCWRFAFVYRVSRIVTEFRAPLPSFAPARPTVPDSLAVGFFFGFFRFLSFLSPFHFCFLFSLQQELRCHAVLCATGRQARQLSGRLEQRLREALHDFRREKMCRQAARLSLAACLYDDYASAIPRRKLLLAPGINNYK